MANKETFLNALKALEKRLNLSFENLTQTLKAFEHPSLINYRKKETKPSYFQRLEFLGDRVLALSVTAYLYKTYPNASEGELAKRLTFLIRTETLADIAKKLNLSSCLHAQKKIFSTSGLPESVLADTTEALLGHIYETLGYEISTSIILNIWAPYFDLLETKTEEQLKDAKSQLQELILKQGTILPAYTTEKLSGEDHNPIFEATVALPNTMIYKATGTSKSKAEQAAATTALDSLNAFKNPKP